MFSSNKDLYNPLKQLDDNKINTIHNFIDIQNKLEKIVRTDVDNTYNISFNYIKKKKLNKKNIFIMNNNDTQFESNYLNSNNSTSPTINSSLTIFNYNKSKNTKKELDKYFHTDQSKKIFKMSKGQIYKNNIITSNIYKNNLKEKNVTINKNIIGPGEYYSFNQFNV